MSKIEYRGLTIIPGKAFKGYDCKVYSVLVPRTKPNRNGYRKRLRNVWVENLNDIEDKIDEVFFNGEKEFKDQTRMEDFY